MILTANGQRCAEANAVKLGLSLETLMQRAGEALYTEIVAKCGDLSGKRCVLLCGRGGNGGDGFVCAQCMHKVGADTAILLCAGEPTGGDAKTMYERAVACGVLILDVQREAEKAEQLVRQADVVVDAVYGIGFHGELPKHIAQIFDIATENNDSYKASADIPSGIEADGGSAAAYTFCANLTVAMVAAKPAHVLKRSVQLCGEVIVPQLGVPEAAFEGVEKVGVLTTAEIADLLPKREATAHKGSFGKLVARVGCSRYRGAAVLCAKGALACGAGLISVTSEEKVLAAVAAHCPESILIDIEQDEDYFAESLRGASAVAVGCGLSQSTRAENTVQTVLEQTSGTVVLDADGINLAARNIHWIKEHEQPMIVTPHIGEFARLCGVDINTVQNNRLYMALDFAREYDVVVVLKSENTVIAAPNGQLKLCTIGNAGLAKGGSGDLLCGCIASFAAMGVAPFDAAAIGVWVHSRAADIAAEATPMHSMTATTVAECLPAAIAELQSCSE